MLDESTLAKITIIGNDAKEIKEALLRRIPPCALPPEYGGKSLPLGYSQEERMLWEHIRMISESQWGRSTFAGGNHAVPYERQVNSHRGSQNGPYV